MMKCNDVFDIGEVLTQEGHPIAMLSSTLNYREANHATNEKELLVII